MLVLKIILCAKWVVFPCPVTYSNVLLWLYLGACPLTEVTSKMHDAFCSKLVGRVV